MKNIYIYILFFILIVPIGCNKPNPNSLQIYAASSLTQVLNELIDEYENNTETNILISYAGSSTLRQQIEYGANADIFISADQIQFEKVKESNLLDITSYKLAENKLSIITHKNNISTLKDIVRDDVSIAVGMNETPIGNYTNQLLSNINQEKIHGENYADSFIKNIVSKERNVKLVASKVLLKEIDVAVVYETDYASIDSNEIYRINIPTDININTSIYGGVLKGSLKYNLSEEFLKYVSSEEVKHIWLKNGFIITDCDC